MTVPTDSVIGVKKEQTIARLLYQTPHLLPGNQLALFERPDDVFEA